MRQALRSSQGLAGLILLVLGIAFGLNYDPKAYTQQDTTFITDSQTYAMVAMENQRKSHERDQELIFIWCFIGFGLLMLTSAVWKAGRTVPDQNEQAATILESTNPSDHKED